MARTCVKFLVLTLGLALMTIPGAVWAQTPADAVADAVANSGVFPVGTTVVSIAVDGAAVFVDLSPEAAPFDLGDAQADAMVTAIISALVPWEGITDFEVTVAGKPLWEYLPPSSAPDVAGGTSPQSVDAFSVGGAAVPLRGVLGYDDVGNDPLPPGDPRILTNELAGKLVALHPSHGSYWHQSYNCWFRAMRTLCGPNPQTKPPGWDGSYYQPSDHYYFTQGFQWGSFYEDRMSPETIRFLKAYCDSSGAETWVSRNLDKNAGDFPVPYNGKYPNCSFPLPKWITAAKYYLEDRGDVPEWVWNEPLLWRQSDKDIRARPYYANYRMAMAGKPWQDCVSLHVHTNAAGGGGARGTEIYYRTSKYPYLYPAAKNYCAAVQSGVINAIRYAYDGFWAQAMYVNTYPPGQVPEWPYYPPYPWSFEYPGYTHTAWANRGVKTRNFGEIREAKMPAGLIELVFHDDWKFFPDHVFMMDQIFRTHVAWGMYNGICNYFGVMPKPMLAATAISSSFSPTLVGPNQPVAGTVTMRNEGMAWCWGNKWVDMVYFPYTVWNLAATANDQFAPGAKLAIAENAVIMPGDTVTFDIALTSPGTTGLYTTEWQTLKDDAYGGLFGDIVTAQIQVDADPPVITITSPAAADYPYGALFVEYSAEDALSGVASVTADIDGTPVNSGDTVCGLALGPHTLTVTATDNLGNTGSASVTFNVVNTVGKTTAGGWIELVNKKATCGFIAEYVEGAAAPAGNVTYQDHDTGMTVKSVELVAMGIAGNQAWIYGTCTIEGEAGHWFRIDVTDNGEPGDTDLFGITLDTGYHVGGTLGGGNITIH